MSIAIRAEGVGKRYRLGLRENRPDTLFGAVRDALAAPVRSYRTLKRLSHFEDEKESLDVLWALRDVSFEIGEGEVVGIIGRNGAGKSTLLKILSRIVEPSTGVISMYGRPASLLEVGTGFHPDLTGRENVFLNGAILGMTKAEIAGKFDAIVDFSGVAKFIDTPVKRYSSGMYVRLAFAVAAHLDPDILIVDEVLAVGDAEFQEKCLGAMRDVSRSGRTVLFVSHNMASIKALCTRGFYMERGQVVADGPIGEVVDRYLSSSVKVEEDGRIPEGADRFYSNGEAHFTHALVVNEAGQGISDVAFGAPIYVRMRLEVKEEIRDALLDVRLCSDGIEVTHSMLEHHSSAERLVLRPGAYWVNVRLDNHLQPGHYLATIGLHHSDGATVDYVQNALDVHVLPVARNGSGWTKSWNAGLVRLAADWDVQPA